MLNLLLAGAALAALADLTVKGWWKKTPVFGAFLVLQVILLIGYRPHSDNWLAAVWVPLSPLMTGLRIGVAAEAYLLHASRVRRLMGLSLAALSVALVAVAWKALPPTTDLVPLMVEIRRYVQIFVGMFLLLYAVLAYCADGWREGWRSKHLLVMVALLLNNMTVSILMSFVPKNAWHAMNDTSFAAAAIAYSVWIILCPQGDSRDPLIGTPTHQGHPASWRVGP